MKRAPGSQVLCDDGRVARAEDISAPLTLTPIGTLRTHKQVKFSARHQPAESEREENRIELLPRRNFENALADLSGFTRIWLIWWFHRNDTWNPTVLPPRGPPKRRGVFATRSPHRPNPVGITPVQLLEVKGRTLTVGPCDLLDGTPILDIKPYIPAYDAFADERAGWVDEVDAALKAPAPYVVQLSPLAQTQAEWLLTTFGIDFRPRLIELLERDPTPHRTRRIKRISGDRFSFGCGAWLAIFTVHEARVEVLALESGYPLRFLNKPGHEVIAERDALVAFMARWPSERPG